MSKNLVKAYKTLQVAWKQCKIEGLPYEITRKLSHAMDYINDQIADYFNN